MAKPDPEGDSIRETLVDMSRYMPHDKVAELVRYIDRLRKQVSNEHATHVAAVAEMKRRCLAISAHNCATAEQIHQGISKVNVDTIVSKVA